jgi:hypothetical protein
LTTDGIEKIVRAAAIKAGSGILQVERVENMSDTDAVVIVRCLSGVARVGDVVRVFDPEGEAYASEGALIIVSLWRYQRSVDFIDSPHVSKVGIGRWPSSLGSQRRLAVGIRFDVLGGPSLGPRLDAALPSDAKELSWKGIL